METFEDTHVLDLIDFLEWLDAYENEVLHGGWTHPDRTHEETARLYLAERASTS